MKNPESSSATSRMRLDQLLVERGYFTSRARARDAILRSVVMVDGKPAEKPGQYVSGNVEISVRDPASHYVSRAALKLTHGLDVFALDVKGVQALDIGASTGGFTQVLLERGASHVTAIDVGSEQMDPKIRQDPRVTCLEGVNARYLTLEQIGAKRPDFLVCDVSFISLKLALPPALSIAESGARGVFLVKPQFEAGRGSLGKGGILRNLQTARELANEMARWLESNEGWKALGITQSPIEGGDGNREFLLAGHME